MSTRLTRTLRLLVTTALLVGVVAPAGAQERPVRLDGRVQWIAGQAMTLQLDTGGSVSVDLVRVPQDQYAVLAPNEHVTVIGVVTAGGRRIAGTAILRGPDLQAP
jgi:hypothetical protein